MTPSAPPSGTESGFGAAWAIARRDLLEFVRDRRTLLVTLLLPMVTYPIVALSSALGVRTAVTDLEARQAPIPLKVAMSGPDAAALAPLIEAAVIAGRPEGAAAGAWPSGATVFRADPITAVAAVEDGAADVWVTAPEGLVAALHGLGTVDLDVQFPSMRPVERRTREQFEEVMRRVAEDARQRRVADAGLPESLLRPLRIRYLGEAAGPGGIATETILPALTASILVLLAVLTMTGAFYPAIDAIAGEKERGTIETLLMAPCSTGSIVFGKFLAVYAVTLATLAANCLSIALTTAVGLRFLPAGALSRLPVLGVGALVTVVAFVGLAALAAATCLAVTTASKSGKEAQNTLTPVILLVAALAGTALVPGLRGDGALALVPFTGQVMVARDALAGGVHQDVGLVGAVVPLLLTLLSSAGLTWLLLMGTAHLLTDEEILFRGPDAATGLFARPAPRLVPTVPQGIMPVVAGLAALWYVQALTPENLLLGIPIHQGVAVVLPLLAMLAWQRIDVVRTLGLVLPRSAGRTAAESLGAASLGAGLFIVSAVVMLAVQGTEVSPAIRSLSARLIGLIQQHPWWVSWTLMAIVPPVAEELLFRGWLLSALSGERPSQRRLATAVVVQAALFAVAHLLPERMPATFALGIVAGVLRVATGSILPAIVLHSIHNSMPLLLVTLAGRGVAEGGMEALATGASTTLPPGVLPVALGLLALGGMLVAAATWGGRRVAAVTTLFFAACLACGEGDSVFAAETLRVGVAPVGVTLGLTDGKPTGPSVDMWDDISLRLGVTTEYVVKDSIAEGLEALRRGESDLFLGPVAMTREREDEFDFTHSVFHSGLRIAVPKTDDESWLAPLSILFTREALQLLAGLVLLTVLVGHVLWWCERGVNDKSFPRDWRQGVWEGTWWGISTLIASGCDDKHVDTVPGRILATAWMLVGTVLIALFTGSLAATLTAERIGGTIHGPRDMAGRVIGTQAGGVSGPAIRVRSGIAMEYRTLDEVFEAADAGEVEAVVAENHTLRHAISRPGRANYRLVGPVFESFDFGIVVPAASPLRERLNTVILAMKEDGAINTIIDRWLGTSE